VSPKIKNPNYGLVLGAKASKTRPRHDFAHQMTSSDHFAHQLTKIVTGLSGYVDAARM